MESQHMKFLRFKRPWNRPFLASEANDNFGTKLQNRSKSIYADADFDWWTDIGSHTDYIEFRKRQISGH